MHATAFVGLPDASTGCLVGAAAGRVCESIAGLREEPKIFITAERPSATPCKIVAASMQRGLYLQQRTDIQ